MIQLKKKLLQIRGFLKTYAKLLLQIICVILLVLVVLLFKKRKQEKLYSQPQDVIVLKELKEVKDRNNKYWSIIQQQMLDELEDKKYKDSLADALGIKPKFIKGRDVYVVKTDTVFNVETIKIYDSVDNDTTLVVEEKNPWIEITAKVNRKGGEIRYSSKDTINRVVTTKSSLFGGTTTTVRLNNTNPYNKITEGLSYTVKEKQPFLTIGPVVSYDIINKRVSFGVGVQYPLIKFKR